MNKSTRRGFTLLEVLLVVAILVIIAGSATFYIMKQFREGQIDIARQQVSPKGDIAIALDFFNKDISRYPTTEEGLKILMEKPADESIATLWKGPYLREGNKLEDPWKTEFQYKSPGENNTSGYDLSSAGPNKTHGDDDDLVNWTKADEKK